MENTLFVESPVVLFLVILFVKEKAINLAGAFKKRKEKN